MNKNRYRYARSLKFSTNSFLNSPVSNVSWEARSLGETKVPNIDSTFARSFWSCIHKIEDSKGLTIIKYLAALRLMKIATWWLLVKLSYFHCWLKETNDCSCKNVFSTIVRKESWNKLQNRIDSLTGFSILRGDALISDPLLSLGDALVTDSILLSGELSWFPLWTKKPL